MKIRNILLAGAVLLTSFSCAKNDGYYDFENTENVFDGDAIGYFQSKPGVFDSLLHVLDRLPEYKSAIQNGDLTLFCPTNASFQLAFTNLNLVRANQKKPALNINTLDIDHLDTLLSKYVVRGHQTTDSMLFVDGLFVESLKYNQPMHAQRLKQDASGFVGGGLVTVYYSDTKSSNFSFQWTRTTTQAVNINTTNSLIHILANNHEFGFGEFLNRMNK